LQESWRQQPATPGYCCDFDAETTKKALAAAVPGEAPAIRDRLLKNMSVSGPRLTHDDMIAMNRSANPLN
jgi:hypothetical protein